MTVPRRALHGTHSTRRRARLHTCPAVQFGGWWWLRSITGRCWPGSAAPCPTPPGPGSCSPCGKPAHPADLADRLGVSRQSLSIHLTCLRGCGLVVAVPQAGGSATKLSDGRLRHALDDLIGPPPTECSRLRRMINMHMHRRCRRSGWTLMVTGAVLLPAELVVRSWLGAVPVVAAGRCRCLAASGGVGGREPPAAVLWSTLMDGSGDHERLDLSWPFAGRSVSRSAGRWGHWVDLWVWLPVTNRSDPSLDPSTG